MLIELTHIVLEFERESAHLPDAVHGFFHNI